MTFASILPVLAAALAPVIIGALWYSPLLFARAWERAHGHTPERLAELRASAGKTFLGSFVAFILIAQVLGLFLRHLGADDFHEGAGWGFHAWIGFALPIGYTSFLFSGKRLLTFIIDSGYQMVYLTVMGGILGAWG